MTADALAFLSAEARDALVEAVAVRVLERLRKEEHEAEPSPWLTADGVAARLGWPVKRVRNLTPQMPHRKVGARVLFHVAEVDEWVDAHGSGPGKAAPPEVEWEDCQKSPRDAGTSGGVAPKE